MYTEDEIRSLIERWDAGRLPRAEWTHAAHLVVAIWFSTHYESDQALTLVRKNIIQHNDAVGTPNTDEEGYHETLTRFWLWVARSYVDERKGMPLVHVVEAFIQSDYGSNKYPFVYYSQPLLFSVQARHYWVEPDLIPLDRLR